MTRGTPTDNYVVNDVVTDLGETWIAIAASTNSQPSTINADWSKLAAKGADGATGSQGPTGATGPQGPQGATGARDLKGRREPQDLKGPQGRQGHRGLKVRQELRDHKGHRDLKDPAQLSSGEAREAQTFQRLLRDLCPCLIPTSMQLKV